MSCVPGLCRVKLQWRYNERDGVSNHRRLECLRNRLFIIMSAIASQITGVSSVCATSCSGADQRKRQSFASLAFVRGIHRSPVDSPHKRQVTRKMFPFYDVIMNSQFLARSSGMGWWPLFLMTLKPRLVITPLNISILPWVSASSIGGHSY